MMTLLLIGIFVTELVKYGVWFKKIGGLSFTRCYLGGIVAVSYIVLICMGVVNENTLIILWNLIVFIIYVMVIECSEERGMVTIQALLINICLSEIGSTLIRMIRGNVWWDSDIELKRIYLINNIFITILLYIIGSIKEEKKFKYGSSSNKLHQLGMYLAITIIGIVIFFTINGFQYVTHYIEDSQVGAFSIFVSFVSFICMACLVMMISYIFNENKRYKLYLEKDMLLLETQKNMYETMLVKNEETKKFRHDIQNHLICLYELVECGDLERVKNYIKGIEGNLHSNHNKVYIVGNSVIDVVLNYYISMLDTGVKVSIEGICAKNIGMSDVELCTVISNLIQNAEEALNRSVSDDKYLKIKFDSAEGYLNMQIRNSIVENMFYLDGINKIPETTKANKDEHGIGIKNVKRTIEKNGGMFEIKVADKDFIVDVMIPLENK